MKKLYAVVKNELLRYFISPLAYVYLVAFLALNGSFAVYFGHFFERGLADLEPMFEFQPWIYLIFIPGIAMRLWAEEFRSHTVIQITTMPVKISALVWGKFLAAWIFSFISLGLTFPFWITVNYLGSPDNSVIALSYAGSFILAGCMIAISQTMSALTKNQVIALVISVVVNFLFFLSGVEYVLGFFREFSSPFIVDMIASFSFLTHFGQTVSGLLEANFLFFALSVIFMFNTFTVLIVSFKTTGTSRWLKSTQPLYYVFAALAVLLGFIGLNLISEQLLKNIQYDFSQEKIYTLNSSSKKILQSISEKITAKFYYSPILGERNPQVRAAYNRIRLILEQFRKEAPQKFTYRIFNPEPLSEIEDMAIAYGLQPLPLIDLNRNAYMGIVFSSSDNKQQTKPFFPLERQAFLEQDLVEEIYILLHKKKTVGVISSLPMFETNQDLGYVSPQWNIINEIKRFYEIKSINNADDLSKIDILMLIHPQELSDEMINEIKRYAKHGGKFLILADTAAESPRIFSSRNIEFSPSDFKGLDKFFGFRIYNEMVVVDLDNSITVDATKNYSTNPIFTQDIVQFVLPESSFNPQQKITKNLHSVLFASVCPLVPDGYNSEFIPLIVAGNNSGVMSSSVVYDSVSPEKLLDFFAPQKGTKVLAALLKSKNKYLPFEAVVVSDTDFIYDTFWSKNETVLENNYFIPLYNNADFILNALDYLSGDEKLIDLRGRSRKVRLFNDIESMRKQNLRDFQIKEHELFNRIERTKKALNEVVAKRNFEERSDFSADELAVIAKTRKELKALIDELAKIRMNMHADLEKFAFWVKVINIALMPALILAVLAFVALFKKRRAFKGISFKINREFKIISGICLLLIVSGGVCVYYAGRGEWSEFENKKVFPDLTSSLNQIAQIELSSQKENLKFVKKDGIWQIPGKDCLSVYQERILSFISAISEMTYFEKKSDRLENLGAFGLKSLDNNESQGTLITLRDENNQNLAEFYLGKYDIDIGRGARAAYIRAKNEFQVWMVKADLIEVSANPLNWGYSSLWNLRFGRLKGFNQNTNLNRSAVMVKELLNTSFIAQTENAPQTEPLFNLKLINEDDDIINLDFASHGDDIYVSYRFSPEISNSHLRFWQKTAEKCYYQISKQRLEEIKNVINTVR
ncbi:MAG: Gldg family protein [Alphaproteobacteria bacterium]|nr:Gldg family protein [Alphaproteobacteria bacterium]